MMQQSDPVEDASLTRLEKAIDALAGALDGLETSAARNDVLNKELFPRYLWILNHPEFARLAPSLRLRSLRTITEQLSLTGNAAMPRVAQEMAGVFRRELAQKSLQRAELHDIYDWLHRLYWQASSALSNMKRFDRDVVIPFRASLHTSLETPTPRTMTLGRTTRRVCYLVHDAEIQRGNPVAPILVSLASAHALEANCQVYVYCVKHHDSAFVEAFSRTDVTVRTFDTTSNPNGIEDIRQTLMDDDIDVVLTDRNSATATWLFAQRVAPIQVWLEMGYPFWSTGDVDWTFLFHQEHREDFGVDPSLCESLRGARTSATMVDCHDDERVDRLRAAYPADAVLVGSYSRLCKITPEYLKMMQRVMATDERVHWVLGGDGDPSLILEFLRRSPVADRVVIHQWHVELSDHARALDVFAETFPLGGCNTAREVMFFGTPVVSVESDDLPLLYLESRDPDLVAQSANEAADMILELVRHPDLRATKGATAHEIASDECNQVAGSVRKIQGRIDALWRAELAPELPTPIA